MIFRSPCGMSILDMNRFIVCSVSFLIPLSCVFANIQIRRENLNKQLKGHTLMELSVKHHHQCARECFVLSLCKSIDYYKGTCKLNDAGSLSVTSNDFEDKDGAIFSYLSDWPKEMVGSCAQRPCSDTQICFQEGDNPVCRETVIATDCSDVKRLYPSSLSGKHKIRLWKSNDLLTVLCDMETDGGGWTIFQSRFDGSLDFYRNSTEYENGFGNLDTEFWLGLKFMQEMVSKRQTELRFDLTTGNGATLYETFQNFRLEAGPNYTIHIDPGQGTAGDVHSSLGPSYQNGMPFTTKDVDRDLYLPENCAQMQTGAWWYNGCGGVNLNGEYSTPGLEHPNGYWHGVFYEPYSLESLKATKLMFRGVEI